MGDKYIYETRMEVRDYECDIEGIVNNANYLHYLEHTRHRFLRQAGLSFAEMHQRGVDAVVARMDLRYKSSLRCIEKQGIRYIFHQDIFREADEALCLKATVELVCLVDGKLANSEEYDRAFLPYFANHRRSE